MARDEQFATAAGGLASPGTRQLRARTTRHHGWNKQGLLLHQLGTHLDAQRDMLGQHQRPRGQRMGADGGEQEAGHRGVHHCTARCQVVGRGACAGRVGAGQWGVRSILCCHLPWYNCLQNYGGSA